ncbi:hypothetical protein NIES39_L03060 [Arthrospira platensis NIES-39]|nr:hypothetical protein NIES39_L03060 [Arthrospira platensis NIES-39]
MVRINSETRKNRFQILREKPIVTIGDYAIAFRIPFITHPSCSTPETSTILNCFYLLRLSFQGLTV